MEAVLFYALAVLLLGSAAAVILFRNPMHSALCLILNLLTVAGVFAALDAHFLAVTQIMVYAGAIMVLVLFLLMLLNLKGEAFTVSSWGLLVGGGVVALVFVALMAPIMVEAFSDKVSVSTAPTGEVAAVGKLLYTRYLYPFELAGMLLLAAVVGAIMMARRQRPSRREES